MVNPVFWIFGRITVEIKVFYSHIVFLYNMKYK